MAAKKNSVAKRKPVPRHARKYLFRNDHPIDQHVEQILDFWKSEKQEITNLRKSVALYYALENGELSALFEIFPQYKAQFAPGTAEALEQFMQILQQQQLPSMAEQQFQSVSQPIPKPLPAPPIAEVRQAAPADANTIADNFLNFFQ